MKKRNAVILVLVIALLLMGSAYALWTDSVEVAVTANSATMDVLIMERTAASGVTVSHGRPQVTEITSSAIPGTGTDSVTETLDNFIPYEVVTFVYRIENRGSIDVLLDSIDFTNSSGTLNNDLADKTRLSWTIQEYDGGGAIGTAETGSGYLDAIGGSIAVTQTIELEELGGGEYCLLTLDIEIIDTTEVPYATEQQTVFTFTPQFTQN